MTEKEMYNKIDDILWNEWDPLGVNEYEEGARNEYHGYIPGIIDLLRKNCSVDELTKHLSTITNDTMGLWPNLEKNKMIAEKLITELGRKRHEILASLPAYGPMHVTISYNDLPYYSEGYVVRFYKQDGTDWVANFQPGWHTLSGVYDLPNHSNILVMANGACYLVNPEEQKPLAQLGIGFHSVIKTENGRLIFASDIYLNVLEPTGEYWRTDRISWDGIAELKLEGNLVKGLSFNPTVDKDEWIEFTLDLTTRIITGGSFKNAEIEFKPKKPWWKFWTN